MILEYKTLTGGIKDVDTKNRIVTGYLANFGDVDKVGDVIEKGAMAKSIMERKNNIYFLNNHDWKQPHGKFNVLIEDNKGLYFESNPLIDTTYSMDLMKLYEAGIVKEHSIGYQTVKFNKSQSDNIRYLKELKLFEGSNVTLGANPNTPFLGMKGLTLKDINKEVNLIVKAMRNGTFTDETFTLLEIALKQLQLEAYNLGKKSLNDNEPPSTQTDNEPILIKTINEFTKQLWTQKN